MDTLNAYEAIPRHAPAAASTSASVLVVSQDAGMRRTLRAWWELEGWAVTETGSARSLSGTDARVVLIDAAGEPHLAEVLAQRGTLFGGAPVIVLAADDAGETAERLLRAGAYDVVARPLDRSRLSLALGRGLEWRRLSLRLDELEGVLAAQRLSLPAIGRDGDVVPLAELERRAIRHALLVTRGNVSEAARLLGVGRSTLYRHLSPEQVAEARPASVTVQAGAVAALR
jgi:DNA-binding NtrC family response regulator